MQLRTPQLHVRIRFRKACTLATILQPVAGGYSHRLILHSCSVNRSLGTVALARGLAAGGAASRLRALDLCSTGLGDATAKALGLALVAQGHAGALRELLLRNNRIGPNGARHLAEGLRVASSLERLNLSCNRIEGKGAAAIAVAIAASGGGGRGCDDGSEVVQGSSSVGSRLQVLLLGQNALGDDGVAALVRGLGRNGSLTELDVGQNGLSDAGRLHLANWAAGCFGVALPEKGSRHAPRASPVCSGAACGPAPDTRSTSKAAASSSSSGAENSSPASPVFAAGRRLRTIRIFASPGDWWAPDGGGMRSDPTWLLPPGGVVLPEEEYKRVLKRVNAAAAVAARSVGAVAEREESG